MLWISVISLPVPILYYFFIPESYQILIAQGRFAEARQVMKKFMKTKLIEKKNLNESLLYESRAREETPSYGRDDHIMASANNIIESIHSIVVEEQKQRESYSFLTIFQDKYMATTFGILMLIWYD